MTPRRSKCVLAAVTLALASGACDEQEKSDAANLGGSATGNAVAPSAEPSATAAASGAPPVSSGGAGAGSAPSSGAAVSAPSAGSTDPTGGAPNSSALPSASPPATGVEPSATSGAGSLPSAGGSGEPGPAAGGQPASDAGAVHEPAVTSGPSSDMADAAAAIDDRCDVGVYDGTPPRVLELTGETFAHDPTLIFADGVFYRFWTGDYVPAAVSTDLLEWSRADTVYGGSYPQWVSEWRAQNPGNTFNFPWAPDVSYFGGKVHLYASFSAFFGRNTSCITHLVNDDLAAFDWQDQGPVICSESGADFNAIDADVELDQDGNPWLAFGSFWDGIQLMPLDGDGERLGDELSNIARASEIEAPVLLRRCGYYYLFVSFGLCCPGEGRSVGDLSYRVVVGRATDIRGPYFDRDGKAMLEGGGTLLVAGDGEQFAAAGHSDVLVAGDKIYNAYHAYRQGNGAATLRIVEMPFDDEGWPVPAAAP